MNHRRAASVAGPVLEAAGFRRRGTEFARQGPGGFVDVLGCHPDGRDGFAVQYGVVTPGLRAFRTARGVPPPDWVGTSDALLWAGVFHPGYLPADRGDIFPYRWSAASVAAEELPARLERALTEQVLPDLRSWHDPRRLAAALAEDRPGSFSGLPPRRAIAMALYELGPSAQLRQALTRLEDGDPVREWIAARLADPAP